MIERIQGIKEELNRLQTKYNYFVSYFGTKHNNFVDKFNDSQEITDGKICNLERTNIDLNKRVDTLEKYLKQERKRIK